MMSINNTNFMNLEREKSSFRDNKATVFFSSDRIFRKIIKNLNIDYDTLLSSISPAVSFKNFSNS